MSTVRSPPWNLARGPVGPGHTCTLLCTARTAQGAPARPPAHGFPAGRPGPVRSSHGAAARYDWIRTAAAPCYWLPDAAPVLPDVAALDTSCVMHATRGTPSCLLLCSPTLKCPLCCRLFDAAACARLLIQPLAARRCLVGHAAEKRGASPPRNLHNLVCLGTRVEWHDEPRRRKQASGRERAPGLVQLNDHTLTDWHLWQQSSPAA